MPHRKDAAGKTEMVTGQDNVERAVMEHAEVCWWLKAGVGGATMIGSCCSTSETVGACR